MRRTSQSQQSRLLLGQTGLRLSAVALAAGILLVTGQAQAQQTAGSVGGRAMRGDQITVVNRNIGITRSVTVDANGVYSVPALPAGEYVITVKRADGTTAMRTVSVTSGEGSTVDFIQQLQQVQVTGSKAIDVKSVESVQTLSKIELDRIPVPRDTTAITMLAPGATLGDGRIGQTAARAGNVPSLGGASPAENAYYINGFNVTNMVNGVAFNQVPYEAVAEHSVKTGGYGPEFGRSLGGVISVQTKRGTNQWHGGANIKLRDSSLDSSSVYPFRDPVTGEWSLKERPGGTDRREVNVWGGGPIIKDKLFVFGLLQGSNEAVDTYGAARQTHDKVDSPQYLVKVDWNVTDANLFEFTAFSDKKKIKTQTFNSPEAYGTARGTDLGPSHETSGGTNLIGKWTSWINDDLTISAMAGKGVYDRANSAAGADCPLVIDRLSAQRRDLGCWTATTVGLADAKDERNALRLDAEWKVGKHTLRAGLDRETYEVTDGSSRPGDGEYQVRNRNPGQTLPNGYVVTGTGPQQIVFYRFFQNGGQFKTTNSAWYLEDSFQVTPNLVTNIGLRNESFTNRNAAGEAFIDVKNTWAPRLGAAWDVKGNADLKVFGNLGRYYLPVYSNTNVRLAGAERDYSEFYQFGGSYAADRFQRPVLGPQLGGRAEVSSGETPDPRSVVDTKIKPMFQDEFIIGMQKALQPGWSLGVKYTHRRLGQSMDDICNDEGPTQWAEQNGYTAGQAANIGAAVGHCFLYNPGSDLNANVDLDGTGTLSPVRIPASALLMPKANRTWQALELTVDREWDRKWSFRGSYVLAFSKGNTEGAVKSDIGQDDAGISQDFDYPGLMEGSRGYLPNDRRHTFKIWGSYAVTDEWRLGASVFMQSGRPKNCFGVYNGTLDGVSQLYGDASFWCRNQDGVYTLNPRGTLGRLSWTHQLNLQATYTPKWAKGLTLSADLINVLDKRGFRSMEEGEGSGMSDPKSLYGQPQSIQPGRSLRLLAQYEW